MLQIRAVCVYFARLYNRYILSEKEEFGILDGIKKIILIHISDENERTQALCSTADDTYTKIFNISENSATDT